jgi:hypothetical protein
LAADSSLEKSPHGSTHDGTQRAVDQCWSCFFRQGKLIPTDEPMRPFSPVLRASAGGSDHFSFDAENKTFTALEPNSP